LNAEYTEREETGLKIRILDRILVALAGLLALAFCAALGAQIFFQKDVAGFAAKLLNDPANRSG
jgi:hypothetical protein